MTIDRINEVYNELNALCFNNKLPKTKLKLHKDKYPYGEVKYDNDKVEYLSISEEFFDGDELYQLMLHEMSHVYIIINHKLIFFDHGLYFWYLFLKFKLKYNIDIRVSQM